MILLSHYSYTKALENVKKFQQEQVMNMICTFICALSWCVQSQECKVYKVDMQHLQKQKEKAADVSNS